MISSMPIGTARTWPSLAERITATLDDPANVPVFNAYCWSDRCSELGETPIGLCHLHYDWLMDTQKGSNVGAERAPADIPTDIQG